MGVLVVFIVIMHVAIECPAESFRKKCGCGNDIHCLHDCRLVAIECPVCTCSHGAYIIICIWYS